MFKFNNKNTRTTSIVFTVTPLSSVSTVDFEQVNVSWVESEKTLKYEVQSISSNKSYNLSNNKSYVNPKLTTEISIVNLEKVNVSWVWTL